MRPLPQPLFDIYALSLPRGLAFGNCPPTSAWQSEDGLTCGILTQNDDIGTSGVLIMRRREDDVWVVILRKNDFATREDAFQFLQASMNEVSLREPLPSGVPRRQPLWKLQNVNPSNIFKLLSQPSHHLLRGCSIRYILRCPNRTRIGQAIAKRAISTRACGRHICLLAFVSRDCWLGKSIHLQISTFPIVEAAKHGSRQ